MSSHKIYIKEEKEEKKVYLDDEVILSIDDDIYYGHKRNQMPELCKILSERFNRTVSSKELSTAFILGIINENVD